MGGHHLPLPPTSIHWIRVSVSYFWVSAWTDRSRSSVALARAAQHCHLHSLHLQTRLSLVVACQSSMARDVTLLLAQCYALRNGLAIGTPGPP